jgi:hypothetical protein
MRFSTHILVIVLYLVDITVRVGRSCKVDSLPFDMDVDAVGFDMDAFADLDAAMRLASLSGNLK